MNLTAENTYRLLYRQHLRRKKLIRRGVKFSIKERHMHAQLIAAFGIIKDMYRESIYDKKRDN